MDVESFWRSCSPQQRLQLLRVPLAPLLAGKLAHQVVSSASTVPIQASCLDVTVCCQAC
jgi:hypothetical protein